MTYLLGCTVLKLNSMYIVYSHKLRCIACGVVVRGLWRSEVKLNLKLTHNDISIRLDCVKTKQYVHCLQSQIAVYCLWCCTVRGLWRSEVKLNLKLTHNDISLRLHCVKTKQYVHCLQSQIAVYCLWCCTVRGLWRSEVKLN